MDELFKKIIHRRRQILAENVMVTMELVNNLRNARLLQDNDINSIMVSDTN